MLLGGNSLQPGPSKETSLGGTWVLHGGKWREVLDTSNPAPRAFAAMAGDPRRRELVLTGGSETAQFAGMRALRDTWTYSAEGWQERHPRDEPTWAPAQPPVAFDERTGQVTVLAPAPGYPGSDSSAGRFQVESAGDLYERWTWDGTDWNPHRDVVAPPLSTFADNGMAEDVVSRTLVFFAYNTPQGPPCLTESSCRAADPSGTRFSQTWQWNGRRWTREHPHVAPTDPQAIASDPESGRVDVLTLKGDMWQWSGLTWHVVGTGGPRGSTVMTADPAACAIVAFEGVESGQAATSETWTWGASGWKPGAPGAGGPRPGRCR